MDPLWQQLVVVALIVAASSGFIVGFWIWWRRRWSQLRPSL